MVSVINCQADDDLLTPAGSGAALLVVEREGGISKPHAYLIFHFWGYRARQALRFIFSSDFVFAVQISCFGDAVHEMYGRRYVSHN